MGTQTRTWQKKIIAGATRLQELNRLYWFVEMTLPRAMGGGYAAATYPVRAVPVVPVGPDPEEQRHWAHLLLELFKECNQRRGIEFDLALTDCDILQEYRWYVYGEMPPPAPDAICEWCGEVFAPTVAHVCMQAPVEVWCDLRTQGKRWAVMPSAWMRRARGRGGVRYGL
ncbi:MAG: hypothetical protein AB7R40_22295 [Nitrospiraceae bacterium]